jgi:hypothetical protein
MGPSIAWLFGGELVGVNGGTEGSLRVRVCARDGPREGGRSHTVTNQQSEGPVVVVVVVVGKSMSIDLEMGETGDEEERCVWPRRFSRVVAAAVAAIAVIHICLRVCNSREGQRGIKRLPCWSLCFAFFGAVSSPSSRVGCTRKCESDSSSVCGTAAAAAASRYHACLTVCTTGRGASGPGVGVCVCMCVRAWLRPFLRIDGQGQRQFFLFLIYVDRSATRCPYITSS